jgi:hypothetical protein
MLDGAPFAAHAQALTRAAGDAPSTRGGLLWTLAAAALLALAFGAVKLSEREPEPAATASAHPAESSRPSAAALAPEANAERGEVTATARAPDSPPEKTTSAPTPAPPKKKPSVAPRAVRSEPAKEESGWVIRR